MNEYQIQNWKARATRAEAILNELRNTVDSTKYKDAVAKVG